MINIISANVNVQNCTKYDDETAGHLEGRFDDAFG